MAATGSIEASLKIDRGVATSLSEEELIDCTGDNDGCKGGAIETAFAWVHANGGILSEAEYPYAAGTRGTAGTCRGTPSHRAWRRGGSGRCLPASTARRRLRW